MYHYMFTTTIGISFGAIDGLIMHKEKTTLTALIGVYKEPTVSYYVIGPVRFIYRHKGLV